MKKIYLAVPYTGMEKESFKEVNKAAAKLMNDGFAVFSPISQGHTIAINHELPTNWKFWEKMDLAFLAVCDHIIVLCLPGWRKSKGVLKEIEFSKKNNIPVAYMSPILKTIGGIAP